MTDKKVPQPVTQQKTDHVAGHVMQGKRWNKETKEEEPAAFLNIYLYETDANGEPVANGTKTLKNPKTGETHEVPNYNIIRMYRIPISTLNKVVQGQTKRCLFYWSPPKQRY